MLSLGDVAGRVNSRLDTKNVGCGDSGNGCREHVSQMHSETKCHQNALNGALKLDIDKAPQSQDIRQECSMSRESLLAHLAARLTCTNPEIACAQSSVQGNARAISNENFTLEDEIESWKRLMSLAKFEITDLERAPLLLHNLKSPFNRFPFEIICIIILHVLDDFSPDLWRGRRRRLSAILSTCLLWRRITLNMPRAWRTIYYDHTVATAEIRTYLQRSKSVDLHVVLRDPDARNDLTFSRGSQSVILEKIRQSFKAFKSVFALIVPHLPKCQTLELSFSHSDSISAVLPLKGPLPSLRSLSITVGPGQFGFGRPAWQYLSDERFRLFSNDFPCDIQHLKISTDLLHPNFFANQPNLRNLVELDLCVAVVCVRKLLEFIVDCPTLEVIRVKGVQRDPGGLLAQPVHTPNLRLLELGGCTITRLLPSWDAPCLTRLEIRGGLHGFQEAAPACPCSFPALRTLVIEAPLKMKCSYPTVNFVPRILRTHTALLGITASVQPGLADGIIETLLDLTVCPTLRFLHLVDTNGSGYDSYRSYQSAFLARLRTFMHARPGVRVMLYQIPVMGEMQMTEGSEAAALFRKDFPDSFRLLDAHPRRVTWRGGYYTVPDIGDAEVMDFDR